MLLLFLLLFLSKNAKGGDCWSVKVGIVLTKNKVHVVCAISPSVLDVVTRDSRISRVTQLTIAGVLRLMSHIMVEQIV